MKRVLIVLLQELNVAVEVVDQPELVSYPVDPAAGDMEDKERCLIT